MYAMPCTVMLGLGHLIVTLPHSTYKVRLLRFSGCVVSDLCLSHESVLLALGSSKDMKTEETGVRIDNHS